jgi:LEM3 (ligand-effect modulator 3) family / CDC50 family
MCIFLLHRYVRSLDSKQLGGKNSTSSACEPIQYVGNDGKNASLPNQGRINPCGLIAWSNFNDTFAVSVGGRSQPIDVSIQCQAPDTVCCAGVTLVTLQGLSVCKDMSAVQPLQQTVL